MKRLLTLSLASIALIACAIANDIGPGSPAPKLDIKTWYKGKPVKELEKNKIYVVEFWATWCGPCIESIPHITELAKKNKDVTFIGVGIWEDDVDGKIKKFVADMGKKMDYRVGYSGNKEGMSVSWMAAAGQNGIPASFIVKNGTIMWIGHPMGLDKPLAEIKAGKFDSAAYKVQFEKRAAEERKQMAAYQAVENAKKLFDSGKRAEAHEELKKIIAESPDLAPMADSVRFEWLAVEDPAAWETKAQSMASAKDQGSIGTLLSFALRSAQKPSGHAMARKALEMVISGPNGNTLDTHWYGFTVYELIGDWKAALACVNKAIELVPSSYAKDDPSTKAMFEKAKARIQAKLNG